MAKTWVRILTVWREYSNINFFLAFIIEDQFSKLVAHLFLNASQFYNLRRLLFIATSFKNRSTNIWNIGFSKITRHLKHSVLFYGAYFGTKHNKKDIFLSRQYYENTALEERENITKFERPRFTVTGEPRRSSPVKATLLLRILLLSTRGSVLA